jgi:hypothetical protein
MMRTGDKPRQTGKGQGATDRLPTGGPENGATHAHEPVRIGDIITEIWNSDEPFLDPIELQDPRVRMWREILRQRYNFNKRKNNEHKAER